MKWSKESIEILRDRYYLRNDQGELLETKPEQLIKRVSDGIAQAELLFGGSVQKSADYFYDAMINKRIMPATPILLNAGTPVGMLSSCFFFSIKDNIKDIFDRIGDAAYIFSRGGGVGTDISNLRPRGSIIRSSKGTSTGPISFLKVFNEMCEAVKSGGRRKGALSATMDINHPDIEEFIIAKTEEEALNNFNISVKVSGEFMELVKLGDKKALKKWRLVTEAAWNNGEPGIVFEDTIKRNYPIPELRPFLGQNPCMELILPSGGVCQLTALNLPAFSKSGKIDWEQLRKDIITTVRFLDDTVEINKYPLLENEQVAKSTRQIGVGVCGFAYTLLDLGITYGSQESLRLAEELGEFIVYHTRLASSELAIKRGSFPLIKGSIYETRELSKRGLQSKFNRPKLDYTYLRDMIDKNGIRNSSITTLQPTGSVSRILDSYFSIEPIFATKTKSNILDGKKQINLIPEKYIDHPNLITAHELTPEQHIKMVAAWMKNFDNSASKTVNLPETATIEDVEKAFMLAYDLKLRATTVYRNSSRQEQVLNNLDNPECKSGSCEL